MEEQLKISKSLLKKIYNESNDDIKKILSKDFDYLKRDLSIGTKIFIGDGGNGALCANGAEGIIIDKPKIDIPHEGLLFNDGIWVVTGTIYCINKDAKITVKEFNPKILK